MQGRKSVEPRLFYQTTLESLVPAEYPIRRLAAVLDLSWVRPATRACYSHTGKPSIDPVVLAKMWILGFLYNIPSERQLLREIQVNLAYRWYINYDLDESLPDHSVLSKARRRFGERFFQQLFDHVLRDCREAGLIAGDVLFLDSTEVRADASRESFTALRYTGEGYLEELERHAEEDSQTCDDEDEKGSGMGRRRPRSSKVSASKRSTTDPDATLSSRAGCKSQPAYKTHVAVDAAEGVVTAVSVSDASTDDTAMVPALIESHEGQLSLPKQVSADTLYGSQESLEYLQEGKSIETVIRQRSGGNKHGGYDKRKFRYDLKHDVYTCPAGQTLIRRRTQKGNETNGPWGKAFYSCDASTCQACSCRAECLGRKSTSKARTITRFDTPYAHRAEAACATARGKQLLKRRQTCVEGVFARGKGQHRLSRARWRGLSNLKIQALVTMTVMNLKKLMKALPGSHCPALRERFLAFSALGKALFAAVKPQNCFKWLGMLFSETNHKIKTSPVPFAQC